MNLRRKVFIFIFTSIFFVTLLSSFLVINRSEATIVEQTQRQGKAGLAASVNSIDNALSTLVRLFSITLDDNDFISLTEETSRIPISQNAQEHYAELYQFLKKHMSRIKAPQVSSALDSIYLYIISRGVILTTDTTYYEDITEDSILSETDSGWFLSTPVNYFTISGKNDDKTLVSYALPIVSEDQGTIGYCILNLKKHFLSSASSSLSYSPSLIIYSKGSVLFSAFANAYSEEEMQVLDRAASSPYDSRTLKLHGGKELLVTCVSEYTGWKYVALFRFGDFLNQLYEVRKLFLPIIFFVLFLAFSISAAFMKAAYAPVDKMIKAMKEIGEGNLDVRISEKRSDEFQLAFDGFNAMAEELGSLVEKLTKEQLLNKEARIKLLQAQVNPHFLYNTLDSVYSIAVINNQNQIAKMVYAMSAFFRVSLSSGKDIITLKDALKISDSYMTIQRIRFEDKFSYHVDIPASLMKAKVPKLILQPFVENSVYHGLEPKEGTGELFIFGRNENGTLVLSVEDNGIGIPRKKMLSIDRMLNDESTGNPENNFAIHNINLQIRLMYGFQYGVRIESRESEGTKVSISIPFIV